MKILVTAKRVTDPDMKIKIKEDGSGIDLSSMSFKVNPFDEIAIEEALRIRKDKGGEVVVVGIGSDKAQTEIRYGLSMGADRGIHVQVDGYMDSEVIAQILKSIVEKEQPDLVFLGKQAVDDDNNQVAQLLAEYLGWGQACFASKIEVNESKAIVEREVDGGIEIMEIDLPGIVSADLRLNEPRYPALPAIMKAKKKELQTLKPGDLGVDITPKVIVKRMAEPAQRKGGRMVADVPELVRLLKEEAKVI
ncbi:MAG: electron transfer flavoprotein subunit beta/FixA family protein [Desulfobacteraceae bacterium]|nr:electron transfer flavoprotein subunit beta/FixA family protein [Desulfobacteraceae bacterium]MBC2755791.1 electron transfer flavoprotein subunit beta/FixA family protein [Desulfobacteraceae bacterium]